MDTASQLPAPERLSDVDILIGRALIVVSKQRVRLLNTVTVAQNNNDTERTKSAQEALEILEDRVQV